MLDNKIISRQEICESKSALDITGSFRPELSVRKGNSRIMYLNQPKQLSHNENEVFTRLAQQASLHIAYRRQI